MTAGVFSQTGLFVCFEGGEGAGKSTQSRLLRDWLVERGEAVLLTFEPGDTSVGKELRRIVLDARAPIEEIAAAIQQRVAPLLERA